MTLGLLAASLVSFVWIAAQMILMHIKPAENRIRSMTAGYLLSLPLVYVAVRHLPWPDLVPAGAPVPHPLQPLLHAYVFHLLVFLLYCECFYHVERAVSLRFLIEILRRGGEVKLTDITEQYNVADMIERRLEALTLHNFVERDGDGWRLKPKGLFFARAMQFSNWIFQSKGQSDRL